MNWGWFPLGMFPVALDHGHPSTETRCCLGVGWGGDDLCISYMGRKNPLPEKKSDCSYYIWRQLYFRPDSFKILFSSQPCGNIKAYLKQHKAYFKSLAWRVGTQQKPFASHILIFKFKMSKEPFPHYQYWNQVAIETMMALDNQKSPLTAQREGRQSRAYGSYIFFSMSEKNASMDTKHPGRAAPSRLCSSLLQFFFKKNQMRKALNYWNEQM